MLSGHGRNLLACLCLLAITMSPSWASPPSQGGASTQQRLWVEAVSSSPSEQASLSTKVGEVFSLPATVEWDCTLNSSESFDHVTARLTIESVEGEPLHEGSVELNVREGANPFRLTWSPENLPDGTYQGSLHISWMSENTLSQQEFRVRQISSANLETLLDKDAEQLNELKGHLSESGTKGTVPPYPAMKLAVAETYLPATRQAFASGDWRRAQDDADFIQQLLASTRAELTFAGDATRLDEKAIPAIQGVTVRDGAFFSDGRPVFLSGAAGSAEALAAALPLLRDCGFNLAVTKVSPADTLPAKSSVGAVPADVNALLAKAESLKMGVTLRLAPQDLGAWTYDAWPALADHRGGTFPYDVSAPRARKILERHIDTVLSDLQGQASVVSVALADGPEMQFSGEPVRKGFVQLAKDVYGDRESMNRIWETLYLNFDEVKLRWDYDRPAYRYDLEVYQQQLGTQFLTWLAKTAQEAAPGIPFQVDFGDRAFAPGESAFGVDREAMARVLKISGCEATENIDHDYLALGYPSQSLYYTLLRSFNPQAPVFNVADSFEAPKGPRTDMLRDAAHTLLWEGAMAGLSASAVPLGSLDGRSGTLLESPERMAGYAEACLDLNRLAPVVAAFQQERPGISIFWSMASKIYEDGDPYLASVKRAYEGCHTFGYKVEFVSETACIRGALERVKILVIPDALSLSNEAFQALDQYIARGGVTLRLGKPMPYNPRGISRQDGLTTSTRTILLRGLDSPESYLHALDAACALDGVEQVPRAINTYGYPLEGVKTRFAQVDGVPHLYVVNLRKSPERVYLTGPYSAGEDLIAGYRVQFPAMVEPLAPMLVRLDEPGGGSEGEPEAAVASQSDGTPSGVVAPVAHEEPTTRTAARPIKRHGTR